MDTSSRRSMRGRRCSCFCRSTRVRPDAARGARGRRADRGPRHAGRPRSLRPGGEYVPSAMSTLRRLDRPFHRLPRARANSWRTPACSPVLVDEPPTKRCVRSRRSRDARQSLPPEGGSYRCAFVASAFRRSSTLDGSSDDQAEADAMTTLSIVIVNYNARGASGELPRVADRGAVRRSPHEIVVVDNASTDGSVDAVRAGGRQ